MKRKPRIYYSDTQKALMWDRWQKGDSMNAIARIFDRGHSSVQRILGDTSGIRPPQRKRSRVARKSTDTQVPQEKLVLEWPGSVVIHKQGLDVDVPASPAKPTNSGGLSLLRPGNFTYFNS